MALILRANWASLTVSVIWDILIRRNHTAVYLLSHCMLYNTCLKAKQMSHLFPLDILYIHIPPQYSAQCSGQRQKRISHLQNGLDQLFQLFRRDRQWPTDLHIVEKNDIQSCEDAICSVLWGELPTVKCNYKQTGGYTKIWWKKRQQRTLFRGFLNY